MAIRSAWPGVTASPSGSLPVPADCGQDFLINSNLSGCLTGKPVAQHRDSLPVQGDPLPQHHYPFLPVSALSMLPRMAPSDRFITFSQLSIGLAA